MKRPSPSKLRLLAAAAFSILSGSLSAATINVTAGDIIQTAVNSATAGDEIVVGPGTYNERVVINKAIKLISLNGRGTTIIDGSAVASGAQGAIELIGNTDGTVIGETGHGFTLVGFDNVPGSEVGALYVQGTHNNLKIEGNDIVANGDSALTFQFNAVTGTNVLINDNIFSGKTFVGAFPATGNQFTVPNVARQVIVIGNGPSNPVTLFNLQFTNNQITAISGATQAGETRGNLLATIDVDGVTVTGNTFAGVTPSRAAFRARRPDLVLTGNTFNTTNVGSLLDVQNNTTPLSSLIAANTVTNSSSSAAGSAITGTEAYTTIQAAVNAAIPGATISVTPGIYNERVVISKAVRLISTGGRGVTTIDASAVAGSALGAIEVQGTLTGVTIGESSAGFTLIGYDGTPGLEAAALYVKGSQTTLKIEGNDIRANGDSALTIEFGTAGSGVLINDNLFSGKTFVGANPAFAPSSQQFTTANVARQLIVIGNGGGAGASSLSGVTFSNNRIEAITGGYDTAVMPPVAWGNNAATIDVSNLVMTGNQFVSTITFGTAFRVRRSGATISGNTFDTTNMGPNTALIITENNVTSIADFIAANTLVKNGQPAGAALTGSNAFTTINAAIAAAALNANINLLAGTYSEYVNVNKAVTLIGAPNRASIVQAPAGAATSAVTIAASNATISGLTITRSGNTVATWNDTLSSAGISIQGAFTNARITENLITGMRTGIDINNSSGHSVFRNVLENNHTGMILRNQTDNLLVEQNYIINNRTVGVLFLDAGGAPPQQAANSKFNSNAISGNWYGQVVDRQTNPSLSPDKLKDFSGNWFGTATPSVVTANSAELRYDELIPVVFGGTASAPGGQPELAGPGSANIDFSPIFTLGTDAEPATYGFQGVPANLQVKADIAVVGAATISNIQQAINAVTSPATVKIPNGTYGGSVSGAGKAITFSIGASPGAIVVNGDFAIDSDDTLEIEIEGNLPGTGYDQYTINGAVSLGGANVVFSGGYSLLETDQILFLVNDLADAVIGTFAGKPNGTVVSFGGGSAIGYLLGSGNDIGLGLSNITVSQGPVTITDGQNTPLIDIGTKTPDSGDPSKVFTIQNSGASPVEITDVTAPAAYTISGIALPLSLEPNQTTTFTVTLTSDTANTHTGTVSITSNEAVGSPFTFGITGFVTPDVVVTPGGVAGEADVDIQIYNAAGTDPLTLTVAVPNDTTYTLTRSSGTWGTIALTGVSSANTAVLTITKSEVDEVNIRDVVGLGSGAVQVTFNGRGSVTSGRTFDDDFNVFLDTATAGEVRLDGNCQFTGDASLNVETLLNIYLTGQTPGRTVSVVDGDLTLKANQGATASSGEFTGIHFNRYTASSSGSGNITLLGRGGNGTNGASNRGFYMQSNSVVESTSTDVMTAGTIEISGTGGATSGATNNAAGVLITGAATRIISNAGGIEVVGSTDSTGTGGSLLGVSVENGAQINGIGSADVTVTGTGGDATSGANNRGVSVNATNSLVTVEDGTLIISGTAGDAPASSSQIGVRISAGGAVSSTGDGPISLTAIAGAGTTDNIGLQITGTGSQLTSLNGDITVTATAGGSGATNGNNGIRVTAGGRVISTGAADINITATEKFNGPNSQAFSLDNADSAIVSTAGTGDVFIRANSMRIVTGGVITATGNEVTVGPRTALPATLGGDDVVSMGSVISFGIPQAEINSIAAAKLTVGDISNTTTVAVGVPVTIPAGMDLELAASGNVELDAVITSADDVIFTSATGVVNPDLTGNDLTAGSVAFGSGTTLQIPIKGTTADSEVGYRKLTVTGAVNLTGSDLEIPSDVFAPSVGARFVIVENDGVDVVTGNFAGLPQGYLIPNFRGTARELLVRYNEDSTTPLATGNDVVLTLVAPEIQVFDGLTELADAQLGVTAFGSTTVGGPVGKQFTITNDGLGTLAISSITAPTGFSVSGAPTSIAPGQSSNFTVTFTAATAGTFSGDVEIVSDDVDEASFTFPVSGTATPQVVVTGTVVDIELANTGNDPFNIVIAVPAAPNDNRYTLTRSAGTWNFAETPGVATGTGTSVLTLFKSGVTEVNITDAVGLGTGLVGVEFNGRAAITTGRTFDDSFYVDLDTATAGAVTFTGNCIFTGTASLDVETLLNISVSSGRTVSVVDGDLSLIANRGAVASSGTFVGVRLDGGSVITNGTGSVNVSGRGGNTLTGGENRGVLLINGGKVRSLFTGTNPGTVTVRGTGGPVTGSTTNSSGVTVTGGASIISSAGGDVLISGDSETQGTGGSHYGVAINLMADVEVAGDAELSIIGVGAPGNAGSGNHGVFINAFGTVVSAAEGKLSIQGTGGSFVGDTTGTYRGVSIGGGAIVSSTGAAPIEITGVGGIGLSDNIGVFVDSDAEITSATGKITLAGTGGGHNAAASQTNYGVRITAGGTLASTGTADIEIRAAGNGLPLAAYFPPFSLDGDGSSIVSSGTGDLEVIANGVRIFSSGVNPYPTINVAGNGVTFRPLSATAVSIGGADASGILGLVGLELNTITAGSITVGDLTQTSTLTVAADVTVPTNANLLLKADGNITQNTGAGAITTQGSGAVQVTSQSGALRPLRTTTDMTVAGAAGLTFGTGVTTELEISINGLAQNNEATGYRALIVAGGVSLHNTALLLTGSFPGANLGDSFVIVENDAADAVGGTFLGLNDATLISADFQGSGKPAWVDYLGGDGNDVELVVGNPDLRVEQPVSTTLVVTPTPVIDFGDVAPGTSDVLTFTLTNEGYAKLVLGTILVQGGSDPEFSVINAPAASTVLRAGESTTFQVRFQPNSLGGYTGSVLISSNDPDAEGSFVINLEGTGAFDPPTPVPSFYGDVVTGNLAPDSTGTGTVGTFGPLIRGAYLAENGGLVFPGELSGGEKGIWKTENILTPNSLKLVALTGDLHPESPVQSYDLLPEIPAINRTGQVSFVARITGSGITADNDTGLWSEVGGPQGPLLVAQEGEDEVLTGVKISGFGSGGTTANAPLSSAAGWGTAQIGADAEVAFSVSLSGTGVLTAGADANATAILRASFVGGVAQPLSILARQGSVAPGATTAKFGNLAGNFSDPVRVDDDGNAAFGAVITGGSGVYFAARGQALTKVAATGDAAPNAGADTTFRTLEAPTLGTDGYVAFRGLLNNTGTNADGKTNDGIWGGMANNPAGLQVLLRRGWVINPDRTVTPTGAPGRPKVGNPWGGWLTRNGDNRGAWRAWVDADGDGVLTTRNAPENDYHGIYANTAVDGIMRLVVAEGDIAQGYEAATFISLDHPLAGGDNQVAFVGTVGGLVTVSPPVAANSSNGNNKGIWRQSPNGGPFYLIIRTGQTIMVGGVPRVVTDVDLPGSGVNITGSRRIEQPLMDGSGRLVIFVTLQGGDTTQVLAP
ncbi:choice-of-anchor D domain-containing protein [Prosthecobacter dejongeii]|uniref:Pectin methylesterase-like acyl-CoA thioesterase n=1 Tax=Prosthecobacter dejongeii TaxID=48465 RepID=A0A7W7YNJ0_9BACT|nr:choice-of-anchor D domain-containing protein [Prosthecobacter dejongeii]MBB5039460.1 pectin methylesterase-like acyl-CoA thioesterase [Prosthecobacter dejongeii]